MMSNNLYKLRNRIISLLVVLVLVAGVLPLSAKADDTTEQQPSNGDIITIDYPEAFVDSSNVHYYNSEVALKMCFGSAVSVTSGVITVKKDGEEYSITPEWNVGKTEASFMLSDVGSYQFEASGASVVKTDFAPVVIDTEAPVITGIEYLADTSDDGIIYASVITATIKGTDVDSGIKEFRWQYVKEDNAGVGIEETYAEATVPAEAVEGRPGEYTATITLPKSDTEQIRGTLKVTAEDLAGNVSPVYTDGQIFIVDTISPDISIQYDAAYLKNCVTGVSRVSVEAGNESADTEFIYYRGVAIDITIEEANFDKQNQVDITIEKDGAPVIEGSVDIGEDWEKIPNAAKYTKKILLKDDGEYVLKIGDYTDKSGNSMKYSQSYQANGQEVYTTSGTGEYTSNKIIIDTEKPTCVVTYASDNKYTTEEDSGDNRKTYYSSDCHAVIRIKDSNFRPNEVEVSLSAEDVTGDSIIYNIPDLQIWEQWKKEEESGCWVAEIPFNQEANYKLEINYEDLAGNAIENKISDEFAVDVNAPDEVEISYDGKQIAEKVLSALTFGIYEPRVKVTFTTYDRMSGVKEFKWTYKRQQGASTKNKEADGGTIAAVQDNDDPSKFMAELELPQDEAEQLRGNITVSAVDQVGNSTADKEDAEKGIIVDTINPIASISYSGKLEDKIVKDDENSAKPDRATVATPDGNTRFVYSGEVKATIQLVEANADQKDDMQIVVTCDGDSVTTDAAVCAIGAWISKGNDTYQRDITLKADGDYVIEVIYSDIAENSMEYSSDEYEQKMGQGTYTSNIITVDTTKPEYLITYDDNEDAVRTGSGWEYYNADRVATIQITDRNFRPSDVEISVVARDVSDAEVKNVSVNASDLKTWDAWESSGQDSWTAQLTISGDARYTIEFDYKDIAKNGIAPSYSKKFVIDRKAPEYVTISYSASAASLPDKILEALTLGFYQPKTNPLTVYVKAKDAVSGIEYFDIDVTGAGVATTVALPQDLQWNADGTYRQGNQGFITNVTCEEQGDGEMVLSFNVPAQFEGKFTANATDYMGNQYDADDDADGIQDYEDNQVVIVDDIAPDVKIEYNGALRDKVDSAGQTVAAVNADTRFVYDGEVIVTITAEETYFYGEDMQIKVTRDNDDVTDSIGTDISDWKEGDTENVYVKTICLRSDGDYIVTVTYADKSGNSMSYSSSDEYALKKGIGTYTSNIITIDTAPPEYTIKYDNNKVIQKIGDCEYYDNDRMATIEVTDRNFRPNEVEFKVKAVDISGKEIEGYTYSKLNAWSDWQLSEDQPYTWVATVPFTSEAYYTIDIGDCADIAGNTLGTSYHNEFIVDKTGPVDVKVSYSEPVMSFVDNVLTKLTFGYYDMDTKPLKVTVEAADVISGVEYFDIAMKAQGSSAATNVQLPAGLKINTVDGSVYAGSSGCITDITAADLGNGRASISFMVPAQFRGEFTASATNYSHIRSDADPNAAGVQDYDDDWVTIVDDIAPQVGIVYQGALQNSIEKDTDVSVTRQDVVDRDENTRLVYSSSVTALITVTEANFYEDMTIRVQRDGIDITESLGEDISAWEPDATMADTYAKTITLKEDGDYVIMADYTDRSGNAMAYQSSEYEVDKGVGSYTSNTITIDTVKPVYEITYDNNNLIQTIAGHEYYNGTRTATIRVTDRNFRPNEVEISIAAKDVTGEEVTSFTVPVLTEWEGWIRDDSDPDCWIATIPFRTDANYNWTFTYKDIAQNRIESNYSTVFTVDRVKATTPEITYSQTIVSKLIGALTFGFYNPDMTVTLKSDDATSGVDYFEWQFMKQADASNINMNMESVQQLVPSGYSNDGKTATASFTVPASARGYISATAYDRSANQQSVRDTTRINVVDNVSPQVSVDYSAVDTANTKVQLVNAYGSTTDRYDNATQVFYNGNVRATVTINEANFFEGMLASDGVIHNVGILLKKTDDNGNVTYTEYLPSDAQPYEFGNPEAAGRAYRTFEWQNNGDVHTFQITYDTDSDYVLTLVYADLSTNAAGISSNVAESGTTSYTSKNITVDKTRPSVYVEYSNHDVKNVIDGRSYYNDQQSATITVTEHNFRADDIAAVITATDVEGNKVSVQDFAGYLASRSSWTKNGNVYTAKITYSADANYTFDIDYKDLAQNASVDYRPDSFTVDATAPSGLTVDYSSSVLQRILEAVTFGFYDSQMTVTISAEDYTSGIWYMDYSYIKSEGVSSVNQELLDERLTNAELEYDGARATTQFTIPKGALAPNSQFNGTVEFYAYDRAEWSTKLEDTRRIVVDNIAPTATVTYNNPVQTLGGVHYYDQDINATLVVEEANFYSEDVDVVVTRDGANYPINVQWIDNSVDTHTGTFTISGDGDYHVTVNYADKSTNKMTEYTSEQMTIDTKMPVITATNVKNESANKDDTISISISVTDRNISAEEFTPELKAVVKNPIGNNTYTYEEETIGLGDVEMGTTQDGDTIYTYTVENLKADGYYTLSCQATDRSNHTINAIQTDNDSGVAEEVEAVHFSVNREGSVFWIETEHSNKEGEQYTNALDGEYVNGEANVWLHEVNVDEVDMSEDKQTELTLNNGSTAESILLDESNYEKNVSVGSGGWYESTYSLTNDKNFKNDGHYTLDIITYDKAQNVNSNINEQQGTGSIEFTIDRTEPSISSNAESDQQINAASYKVELVLSDANLDTESIEVNLNGSKVKDLEKMDEGVYGFELTNNLNQSFTVDVRDLAGNVAKTYKVDNLTVSTNIFVLWYADKKLFWSSIIGFVVVAGGLTVLIIFRKKSKKARE